MRSGWANALRTRGSRTTAPADPSSRSSPALSSKGMFRKISCDSVAVKSRDPHPHQGMSSNVPPLGGEAAGLLRCSDALAAQAEKGLLTILTVRSVGLAGGRPGPGSPFLHG